VTILNLIVKGGFGSETKQLKDPNRFGSVGNHLGEQLFKPAACAMSMIVSASARPTPRPRRLGSATILISPKRRDYPWRWRSSTAVPTIRLPVAATINVCALYRFIKPDFDLVEVEQVFFEEGRSSSGTRSKDSPTSARS